MQNIDHAKPEVEETKRALDRLWILFKERGKGTIRHVERELGLAQRALYSWRSRKQLRYADLLAILAVLDEDPAAFFLGLFPPPTTSEDSPSADADDLSLLLNRWKWLRYEDPASALTDLVGHGERFGDRWTYCLAVGATLKILDLWSKAEHWIDRARALAPDAATRASCLIHLCPILIFHRASPTKAIALLDDCTPTLVGPDRSLATFFKALALRAQGDFSACAKHCARVLVDGSSSANTIASSWQTLSTVLHHAGDLPGAKVCLEKALPFASNRWSRGHILWSMAKLVPGQAASSFYQEAFRAFGKGWLFECFELAVERFARLGFEHGMWRRLLRRCRLRNDLFLSIAEELEASCRLESREVTDHLKDLRERWDRWKLSQVRTLRI